MTDTPIRYVMTDHQMAAAITVAGLRPSGVVLDPQIHIDSAPAVLVDSGLTDGQGTLLPAVLRSLQILSHPTHVQNVMSTVVGSGEWRRMEVASNRGGWVAKAKTETGFECLLLDSPTGVAVVVDDFLDLTTFVSPSEETEATLTPAGWWGILAAADLRRSDRLRAELERTASTETILSEGAMMATLSAGAASSDSRWLVSAMMPLAPFRPTASFVSAIDELVAAGLASKTDRGVVLTEAGKSIADGLAQSMVFGALTQTIVIDRQRVRIAEISIFRGPMRLLVGMWTGLGTDSPTVVIVEPSSETAVTMIRDVVRLTAEQLPAPPPQAATA